MAKITRRQDLTHNHQKKIVALFDAGKISALPGTVHHVHAYHDDWCDLLAGTGPCNCDPDLEVTTINQHKETAP